MTWAQGTSGNVLVSIAKAQGYFDEVGLTVNEIPLDDNQIQAVSTGQVDIASNTGTWAPLKNTVFDNYRYMMAVHGVDNVDKSVKLEDRIYNELYKEALDEAEKKWGSEDPDFYEAAQKFYTEHNTNQ